MFNAMIETLKKNPRKIVFTEGHDARILEATARLVEGALLHPHSWWAMSEESQGQRR